MAALSRAVGFLARQPHNWKITAIRTSIYRLLYQMTLPFNSIYTVSLGATGVELGLVNSIGMGFSGIVSPITGWMIDRLGMKRIYLTGIIWLAISYAVYSLAHSWPVIIIAMLAYWLGFATSMHSCGVICANSVLKEERATVMSCCETLAAGLLGLAGPMIGALLVTNFGGLNTEGIRPLFIISFFGTIASFFVILFQLSSPKDRPKSDRINIFQDMFSALKQGRNLGSFLVISALTYLPHGMIIPFAAVYAKEVKGADQYVLGAMVTASALCPFFLGLPLGRLADKIGRKRVIYVLTPLFWLSNLMLVWAPNSQFLIASGVFLGFFSVITVVTNALTFELVPAVYMGRWMGMVRMSRMLVAAISAFIAGFVWDNVGPQYIFLGFVVIDLAVRIPLLMRTQETLRKSS